MRPLIQYDLDEPPMAPAHTQIGPVPPPGPSRHARRPPAKKRKRHHHPQKSLSISALGTPVQHWDDPGSAAVGMVYDDQEGDTTVSEAGIDMVSYADGEEEEEEGGEYGEEHGMNGEEDDAVDAEDEEDEESRPLTHEEIWDDAALIEAWNSAEAEYEAYHGISKAWKTEPVKKSPLWYNKPHTPPLPKPKPTSKPKTRAKASTQEDDEPDTAPLDFHTFVPTHDPSLAGSSYTDTPAATAGSFFVPPPSTTMVSRDEAFNNALSAMYWSGYWTAVYHSQSSGRGNDVTAAAGVTEENEIEADEDENEDDLVPAQR